VKRRQCPFRKAAPTTEVYSSVNQRCDTVDRLVGISLSGEI